jgi:hypothetical protein
MHQYATMDSERSAADWAAARESSEITITASAQLLRDLQ